MLNHDEEDSWWVAIDGEVQDNMGSLPDVSKIKEQHGSAQVSVLHASKAEDEDAEWIIFERDPAEFKLARDRAVGKGGVKVAISPFSSPQAVDSTNHSAAAERAESLPIGDLSNINSVEEFVQLREEVLALRDEVEALKSLADELKQPILEAHQVLEEREKFLEISENSLFDKAQKQEVLQTELEQLREELHERERAMTRKEKVSG